MPVHPLIASRFPLIADIPGFKEASNNAEFAEMSEAYTAPYGAYSLPDVVIEGTTISGPHGPIPVRLYRPRTGSGDRPGLLWMHGGGFLRGDLDMTEAHVVSAELAARGVVVGSVDYRLASESVHYPVPLDDVAAAWSWFCNGSGELDIDSSQLAIGGASAGANLATAATLRARDGSDPLPAAMLLAYPVLHFPVPAVPDALAAEMRELPRALRFLPEDIVDITWGYLGRLSDIPGHLMPGLANLKGMPPTRIVLSEYDDLRSSGELFELQLREARVPVVSTVAEGMLHGHLNLRPCADMPEIERSLDFLADWVSR
jgi:acetyl esterase